jgi:spermidine synthase
MNIIGAYLITFIASFCILVIEIVAGRILAPYVGVSLYTWTSIIGVVLAGISIGAYLGGWLADRFPTPSTLAWLLIISGIAVLIISPITNLIAGYQFPTTLMLRILIVTTITFFIPSCILGMISPVVVKLAVKNIEKMGHAVGKIYAISTLGSISGTFAAGFFLISWLGTRQIILLTGCVMMLTGLIFGATLKMRKAAVGVAAVALLAATLGYGAAFKPQLDDNVFYYTESDYYTIQVAKVYSRDEVTVLNALVLDNLTHSYVQPEDSYQIEYQYERIYGDVLKWKNRKNSYFRTLSIGGGGYTFPRYMDTYYPNSDNLVVEIDPVVTRTAFEQMGVPGDTRIKTINQDGRWFVMNCKEKFDVVFIDAYNDLSIPYHLTTKEFAQQIKNIMNPGGIVLTNIIDNFQQGSFLPSYMRTLRSVFGEKNVHLISIDPDFQNMGISTFIVMTGNGDINMKSFSASLKKRFEGETSSEIVPEGLVNDYIKRNHSVLLTDDYAPIDNLIAPVFEDRFGYKRES